MYKQAHSRGQQKADRILAEELSRLGWTESDLAARRRSDPSKLAGAVRLRNFGARCQEAGSGPEG